MVTEADVFDTLKYRVVVDRYGTRRYYNSANQLHCEDGPAIVCTNGYREWWQNGLRHREDGPAVINPDGRKVWWIDGVEYSEQEYHTALKTQGRKHDK